MEKRPTLNDKAVIRFAAEKLLPAVKEWLKQADDQDYEEEDTLKQLCRAIQWDHHDGYQIAKRLDSDGWVPDAALVEILDDAMRYKQDARDVACAEWMKTSGLTAPTIGARVRCPSKPILSAGTVAINDDMGRSGVIFDNERQRPGITTKWRIIEWELLTPAEEVP